MGYNLMKMDLYSFLSLNLVSKELAPMVTNPYDRLQIKLERMKKQTIPKERVLTTFMHQ